MVRHRIFDRPDPPNLWIVLTSRPTPADGTPTPVSARGRRALGIDLDARPPLAEVMEVRDTGAHAGLAGSFHRASVHGKPDLLYIDAVEGVTIERSALVRKAAVAFDLVRSDALTRNDSRDLILKVAEERWNA